MASVHQDRLAGYWFVQIPEKRPEELWGAVLWYVGCALLFFVAIVEEIFPYILYLIPAKRVQVNDLVASPYTPLSTAPSPAAASSSALPSSPSVASRASVTTLQQQSASGAPAIHVDPALLRIEASMASARVEGLLGQLRLRGAAKQEEHLTESALRTLRARQSLLEEQRRVVEASGRLRQTVLNEETKTAEAEHRLNRAIRGEMQTPPPGSAPRPARAPAQPPVQRQIADEDIEYVALQLLMEGVVTERQWESYRKSLSEELPPYVVAEIGERLRELWRKSGRSG